VGTKRLVTHYEEKYASEAKGHRLTPLALDRPRPSDRFEAAVSFLPRLLPQGAEILELGAGGGLVAESLRAGGVDFSSYMVSENSDARLSGLKDNLSDPRYRVLRVDADDVAASIKGSFDAVIMIALIEHLIDPMRAMADIRALLKPGGFVYIDTPNIAKWTRRVKLTLGRFPSTASTNEGLTTWEGGETDLYDEGHLHYFTYRSLTLMLTSRCGYSRVERFGYFLGPRVLGARLGTLLARRWPSMFSEIACVAYK
jgi:SAM-dependent methyltransferase